MEKQPTTNNNNGQAPNSWASLIETSPDSFNRDVIEKLDLETRKGLIGSLDPKAKEKLEATLEEIDEDEAQDYSNPNKISNKHSHEEYDHFREEEINSAISNQISNLDPKAQEDLEAILREIDEDETQDFENPYKISNNHTREEYERYRQEAIAQALKTFNADSSAEPANDSELQAAAAEEAEAAAAEEAEEIEAEEVESKANEFSEAVDKKERELVDDKIEELEEAIRKKQQEENTPLTAINADFSYDKADLARQYAEKELNEEVAASGFIKRLWKGTLFKKYYQKKFEREILSEERKINLDGKQVEISDIIADSSDSAIERFILGATEEFGESYIHTKAGEKLTEADAKTTEALKAAIETFAQAKVPEDGEIGDIKRELNNSIARIKAEARDKGEPVDESYINNYARVAEQARERVEHGIAIEKVMEGFKVYNAEVRNNLRSEVHRDNIDKIVNKWESNAIGQFIPPEVVAAAVGAAVALTQTGARAALGIVGGMAVSGVMAGLRERNRVTEDRTRMMRDAAINNQYEGTVDENAAEGTGVSYNKRRAKYEANLGGTIYDIRPANELASNLEEALEGGDSDAILQAIAEARVRVDYSDSEQKDLISYSDANQIGDERLKLDIALIRAEKSLSEEDAQKLKTMKEAVQAEINKDVDEKDADFRVIRRRKAIAQAGKTIAIGSTFFFASQEIQSLIDPNKLGLFEKAGLIKHANNEDARESILAGLAGPRVHAETIDNVSADDVEKIARLEADGYQGTMTQAAYPETVKDVISVSPSASTAQVHVAYDGWANNGTTTPDFNELRAYLNNGQISSGMLGESTMNGQSFNYQDLVAEGHVKGYITVGGAKFEVVSSVDSAGNLTWGENGVFTTPTGETIRGVGSNGEKLYQYFEIAVDNGVDANGVTHIMPLATDVGNNTFNDTIQQVVDTTVEHPATYSFTKDIPREVYYGGVIPGVAPRTALGQASRVPTPEDTPEPPEEPEPTDDNPDQPTGDTPETPNGTTGDQAGDQPNDQPGGQTTEGQTNDQPEGQDQPSEDSPEDDTPTDNPTDNPTNNPANNPTDNPADSLTDNPDAPAQGDPEQDPTDQGETTANQDFHNLVQAELGHIVGEEGVNLIATPPLPPGDAQVEARTRINSFWNSLNQDQKDAVANFMFTQERSNGEGSVFYNYLKNQIGPNNPPANTQPEGEG